MPDQRGGGISWTDETWNPIRGCSRVSAGCRNCYAERIAATRLSGPGGAYHGLAVLREDGEATWTGKIAFAKEHLEDPLRWTRPRRIFVNSMSDLFHESLPVEVIKQIFAVMAVAQRHQFQVLTKRAARMAAVMNDDYFAIDVEERAQQLYATTKDPQPVFRFSWPLSNVWMGVSVEDQPNADARIPELLMTPAAVRWLSCEPLLGPVDLSRWIKPIEVICPEGTSQKTADILLKLARANFGDELSLDWIVAGGESGQGARPTHPGWIRHIRDQVVRAGVPFHFKQWGDWRPVTPVGAPLEDAEQPRNCDVCCIELDGEIAAMTRQAYRRDPDVTGWWMARVGKRLAGRLLDGRTWDEWPDNFETTKASS